MTKRTTILVALAALILALAAGTAVAKTVFCLGGDCFGTKKKDTMFGSLVNDDVFAKKGADSVFAANLDFFDSDAVSAGPSNDFVDVLDEDTLDIVNCGSGIDTVAADDFGLGGFDLLFNCEFAASSEEELRAELNNPQILSEEEATAVKQALEAKENSPEAKQAQAAQEQQAEEAGEELKAK